MSAAKKRKTDCNMSRDKFRFCIDRGGTFTDVYAEVPSWCSNAEPRVLKLLSEDPANYANAPREGIRRILEEATGQPHPREEPVDASQIDWIRMGTTVATNGLLEREGSRFALLITQGFGDALEIGNQARPLIFDIAARKLPTLYERVLEVDERCRLLSKGGCIGGEDEALSLGLDYSSPRGSVYKKDGRTLVMGATGEWVEVLKPVDLEKLRPALLKLFTEGFRSVAIAFAHSYAFGDHEEKAASLARGMGFEQVSVSSELMPTVRLVPRGQTACVDAYLTPFIRRYLDSFTSGFKPGTLDLGGGEGAAKVSFMQSDGGLTPASSFFGFRAVLSGPAGGVVGYATTTRKILEDEHEEMMAVIGFDMGGTSTDVSRCGADGRLEHVFETETAGVKIAAPQLEINTVAAGGGSRLFYRSGVFMVGPESAKAHPGPVCYRKQGLLALTDANLFLGRLVPAHFPKLFGPGEDEELDVEATKTAMGEMTRDVNQGSSKWTAEEVAAGFVRVANETMCRPIRELSEARGLDPSNHVLACFGGAGAQHTCAIARALGIKRAVVHAYAGILSAYGMGLADVVVDKQLPSALSVTDLEEIARKHKELAVACLEELQTTMGFPASECKVERYLHLRYEGTDKAIMVPESTDTYVEAMREHFRREYGFELSPKDRPIIVDDIRVRCSGHNEQKDRRQLPKAATAACEEEIQRVYFTETGWVDAKLFFLEKLLWGHELKGPALVINGTSTIVIEPPDTARVTKRGDLIIDVAPAKAEQGCLSVDPVQLSVMSNRFMSIAEQMGRTLQRTATSVNMKERLDFSCAIFQGDGGLVANAPHVPVHLGAMADTVRYQVGLMGGKLRSGDVIVTNAPSGGGSHLPDITVITPVFDTEAGDQIKFYCASRGHHADVGGSTPGSMPADSTTLLEEGAVIKSFLLVKRGVLDEAGIVELLSAPGKTPSPKGVKLSGCRNMTDVLSDLKAQTAANAKGIELLRELMRQYSTPVVLRYMSHVQSNAALCVREMIKEAAQRLGSQVIVARDYMDDGVCVELRLLLDGETGGAEFDFRGCGPQVYGNWNAPRAITTAAVLYCLRLMVGRDIPLNSGCLEPVRLIFPDEGDSLLSPSPDAAVCAGNVLTSMRVTDVILRAFGACAASQGCMNNLSFGDDTFGYYETIAGGSGAGPGWHGTSGVQCHMTNTRMTDLEIMEKRYPVLVQRFEIRRGSGGRGLWEGGCGVTRELRFLRDGITVSLLTERRAIAPYGLEGGEDAQRGKNTLVQDGRLLALPSKVKLTLSRGDVIRIDTPGGGGYGSKHGSTTTTMLLPELPTTRTSDSTALGANNVEF